MKRVAFILVILFYAVLIPAVQADEIKCAAAAYVIDPDPSGLNVRAQPNGNVITRLPSDAMVTITACEDGWVKIADAEYYYPDFAEKNHHPCDGERTVLKNLNGWVFAKRLGTSVRNYDPGKDEWLLAEKAVTGKKAVKFEATYACVVVLGCSGEWLKVQYQGKSGWLDPDLNCPNSLTTCP